MINFTNNFYIAHGNAINLLKTLADESIDCLVTDPPYETISGGTPENEAVNRPSGILKANDGKIFSENSIDISCWITDVYRVMKQNTQIYIMTNFLNLEHYMAEIRKAGFVLHNLLIWEKNNATPNRWYMKNCEYIIFARKGAAKPINNCGSKTVLQFKNVKDKIHPTEKPVDLLALLISNSTNKGDIVLDPFFGSASTLYASLATERKCIGFELDEKYFKIGKNRLENYNPEDKIELKTKEQRLTPNQKNILTVLENNPDKDFSGAELSQITGLSSRTCSGCITPLCSAGKAIKTNNKSPFRIKLKK